MKTFVKVCLFLSITLALAMSGYSQRLSASLDQGQEVPPTGSAGVGYGNVVLNADQTQITVNMGFTGLGTAAVAAHIHTAPVGVNGGVTFGLAGVPGATSGTIPQQTFAVTPAQVATLLASGMYFNVHSSGFPGGEIRGQILPPSCTTAGPIEVHATAGTMGPTGYGTLSAAVAAINAGTHQGAIDVEVCANVTETAAMFLNSGTGAAPAAYTSVNIYPLADGLTISGPTVTGRGLIELNGADNVTIDGDNPLTAGTNRNLTITNTAVSTTTLTSVIRIAVVAATASGDNNTIRNLNLNGSATGRNISTATSTTASENNTFVIYAGGLATGATTAPGPLTSVTANTALAGTTINALNISNNAVNQAARAIVFNGAASSVSTGVTVSNNLVGDQTALAGAPPYTTPTTTVYTKGIYIAGTNAASITGNSVRNILSYVGTTMTGIDVVTAIGTGAVNISTNTVLGVVNNGTGSGARGMDIASAAAGSTITVSRNTISNIQCVGSVTIMGFRISTAATGGTIEKNSVSNVNSRGTGTFGAYGMTVDGGTNLVIKNNTINEVQHNMQGGGAFSTTFGVFGMRIAGGTGHSVHNNSVNLFSAYLGTANTNLLSAAFAIAGTGQTGLNVRNNIFNNNNSGGSTSIAHVAVFLPTSGTSAMNLTMNNNNYFSGATAGVHGVAHVGTTYTAVPAGPATYAGLYTLADFDPLNTTPNANFRAYTSILSAAGTNDNASIKTDPLFVSNTDLHLQAGSLARDVGAIIATVTDDIDNQQRPGLNALYDIGADEVDGVTPPANDIQATAFVDPANGSIKPAAVAFSPQASFTNNGTSTQTGVTVRYRICTDGTCTTEVYNQTSTIGSIVSLATANVTFPSATLPVGIYTIKARSELGTDTVPANDEITGTLNVIAPLSGSYTAGSGGNFPSLTNPGGIFEALNAVGATGPVTINITSDLTGETGTHAINPIAGNPAVLIKPSGAPRTISGVAPIAVIRINGADNIRIDGSTAASVVGGNPALRELTVQNLSTSTSSGVIHIGSATESSSGNTVQNVNAVGTLSTTVVTDPATLSGITTGGPTPGSIAVFVNNNTVIENCSVRTAIFGIASLGVGQATPNTGTRITQNDLAGTGTARIKRVGIFIHSDNGGQIIENSIGGIDNTGESADAVGIGAGSQGISSTTTTTTVGVQNMTITRNKINGVSNDATFSAAGIIIAGVSGATNTISNNMVTGVISDGNAGDLPAGIFVTGVTGATTRLYYNSVAMTGDRSLLLTPGTAQLPSYGLAISGTDPIVELKNNIFYTTQLQDLVANPNSFSYAIGTAATTFVNLDSNFNDFWSTGAADGGFRSGSLATAAGTSYIDLTAWNTAIGGADDIPGDSLEVDPLFVNPLSDLHLIGITSPVYDQGTPVSELLDFDGTTRSIVGLVGGVPDMGGDEIMVAPTAALASVKGRVITPEGRGLLNATVILTNTNTGEVVRARTTTFGHFNFTDLPIGDFYILEVNSKRYLFDSQQFTLTDDLGGIVMQAR